MTVPIWQKRSSESPISCDLAVVGAGIAGLSVALHAQRLGRRVVVLEQGALGRAASSRNAGFLMRGAADNYASCIRSLGRQRARELWDWTQGNLRGLRNEGISDLPSFKDVPSCLLAFEPGEAEELRRSAQLLCEDGFEVELASSGADAPWRFGNPIVGLVNPNDAAVNPRELLQFLAAKLDAPPLVGCAARSLSPTEDGSSVRITCDHAVLTAPVVVVCTNAWAPQLAPALTGLITPNRGQMLALSVDRQLLGCSYYANHGSQYFRQPDPSTIVVGGCRTSFAQQEQTDEDQTTDAVQREIEAFIGPLLGIERIRVIARWSGIMGFTPDGLPIAGPIDPSGRIWACAGFTGHGMSMAFQTAKALVHAIADGAPPPFPLDRLARAAKR